MDTEATKMSVPYCQKVLPLVYDESLSYYESICKLVDKINDLVDVINDQSLDVLNQANAYTDSKVSEFNSRVDELEQEFNKTILELNENYETFSKSVNNQLNIMQGSIQSIRNEINADIAGVNARTDYLIQQNNEYIIEELSKSVQKYEVINYFTGLKTTIQDMFDYLAQFHLTNSIKYVQLASREKTVNEIIAYNMTYTDLIMNGGTIIQA